MFSRNGLRILPGLIAWTSLIGCGEAPPPPMPKLPHHIMGLQHIHLEYMLAHRGKAPNDAAELRAWAEKHMKPERMRLMGVSSLDDAFVSPRDQQPYVVRPVKGEQMETALNPENRPKGARKPPLSIHEAKGVNGKRFAAFAMAGVEELPEAAFQRMTAP